MTQRRSATTAVAVGAAVMTALATGTAVAATAIGPSTTVQPYVLPVADGVDTTSLLTVGNLPADNGYRMVGIPDGLGAYRSGEDLIVLENQELPETAGTVRRHGQRGAFVSRFVIDPATGRVKAGSDLINPGVQYWNYPAGTYSPVPVRPADATTGGAPSFTRFCSGSLTQEGRLLHGSKGYDGQLYFANEEAGDEGRAFGVTTDGQAYQLPRLGLFSWENTLTADTRTDATVVMGNEDGGSGQLRVYTGTKAKDGSPVDKAGLTNGTLSVVNVPTFKDARSSAAWGKGNARAFELSEINWNQSGRKQNEDAAARGTSLNRIEDGHFDPTNRNDYYFLTTEGGSTAPDPSEPTTSRDGGGLWRLSFKNIEKPELGGTLTLLLDGTEAPYLNKPDNMTIDDNGNLLIQEDPGGNAHLARIVSYRISDGSLTALAQFNRALFTSGEPGFITQDEESSGIIDLGGGRFLLDAQVHAPTGDPETVERGQLLTLTVDWDRVYSG